MDPLIVSPTAEALGVSRETFKDLQIYVDLLFRWQRMLNLVSPKTLPDVWSRHVADSLQIFRLAPDVQHWVDLGSGGGFPGLVTAICLKHAGVGSITLIESDQRKCAFLREVIRATSAPARVLCGRIEDILPDFDEPIDAFSARALAPLPVLLSMVSTYLERGARAYFLKGKDLKQELTAIPDLFRYSYHIWPSQIQSDGSILEIWSNPAIEQGRTTA